MSSASSNSSQSDPAHNDDKHPPTDIGKPPAHEDNVLDSIGKAITAPMRDDPGTDVDEKPDSPLVPSPKPVSTP